MGVKLVPAPFSNPYLANGGAFSLGRGVSGSRGALSIFGYFSPAPLTVYDVENGNSITHQFNITGDQGYLTLGGGGGPARISGVAGFASYLQAPLTIMAGSSGTVSTVEALRVYTPTTADTAANSVHAGSTTSSKPLVLQQFPSGTNVFLDCQRSDGVSQFSIAVDGSVSAGGSMSGTVGLFNSQVRAGPQGANYAGAGALRIANAQTIGWRNFANSGDLTFGINASDTLVSDAKLGWIAGNQQSTVGAAGGASALPAAPTRYLKVVDSAGTTLVIPAYAAS